jgi:hypothetical protein
MIIPHDHHPTDSDICKSPVSPKPHSPVFPYHCHAFNDLASEKATNFVIIKYVSILDFTIDYNSQISNQPQRWIKYFDNLRPTVNSDIQEYASLRAPPSIS